MLSASKDVTLRRTCFRQESAEAKFGEIEIFRELSKSPAEKYNQSYPTVTAAIS